MKTKKTMTDAQIAEKKAAKSAYDKARKAAQKALAATKRDERAVAKRGKTPKAAREGKPRRTSALDAAAAVLAAAKEPMRAKHLIEQMAAKGLWTSPGGKTPEATLYAAMVREIKVKGDKARFRKTDRGLFATRTKGS